MTARWDEHARRLRDPAQITAQWEPAGHADPEALRAIAGDGWWDLLAELGVTLLVTREYEHLVLGLSAPGGRPHRSHLELPHPSGLAVDEAAGTVHVAATRNPNQVFALQPVTGMLDRLDAPLDAPDDRPLVPVASQFLPGALYIHDLAMIGGTLHANAVGENAVVALPGGGRHERVWWPAAIDGDPAPAFGRNHLQLNSIAAGADVAGSFFSASTASVSARRPGHANFPVDGRGVIFSGATREPVATGLTRPHSARLRGEELWVDNSGYGEVGVIAGGAFEPVAALPGWTRGLCFVGDVAFVATSRVIPRFRQYAPGLDVRRSVCGVHAIDTRSGAVLASIRWPQGNQIFALEAVPVAFSHGLPQVAGRRRRRTTRLFYGFETQGVTPRP